MPRESKTINTKGTPTILDFQFEQYCPRLIIHAFNADDPADKYYLRVIEDPEKDCNIRFPVTPENLTIEFVTDNPFQIHQYIRSAPGTSLLRNIDIPKKESIRSFGVDDVKIVWVDDIPFTPSKIFVGCPDFPLYTDGPNVGQIWCSRKARARMNQQTFAFIIDHELEHLYTDSEEEADAGAFLRFMRQGYSISQAYLALVDILGNNPTDVDRKMNIWRIANNFNEKYN